MNHRIKGRRLSRNSAHRKSLMRNLVIALAEHQMIKTTLPKAKELRPFFEKLVTIAKVDSLANRRLLLSILANEQAVKKFFEILSKKSLNRNGGYLRIMKFGFRTGDKAPMAVVEFVDRDNDILATSKA